MEDNLYNYTAVLYALGWAIAHSLWQMGLIWLVFQLFFGLHKNQKPALRYGAAILLTTGGFLWFILSFVQQFRQYQLFNRYLEQLPFADPGLSAIGLSETVNNQWIDFNTIFSLFEKYIPYLSAAYLIVLILLLVRLVNAYAYTQNLRVNGVLPAGDQIDKLLGHLKKQMSLARTVKIYLSEIIDVPATIGFLKPVILLPVALVNQLSTEQVESIILHELAHIRRQDYLLNMAIAVMETILFFNPFVHLLTKSLKKERELFCDDFVVSFQQNPQNYAAALLSLEKMRRSQELKLAVAATGHDGVLLNRIKRILNVKSSGIQYKEKIIALIFISILLSTLAWINPDPGEKKMAVRSDKDTEGRSVASIDAQAASTIAELIQREAPEHLVSVKPVIKKNSNAAPKLIVRTEEKTNKHFPESHTSPELSAFSLADGFPGIQESDPQQRIAFQSPTQEDRTQSLKVFDNYTFSDQSHYKFTTTADSLLQAELLARKGNLTKKEFELYFQRIREMQESGFHFSPWFLQKMTALYRNEWNNSRNIQRPARKIPEREKAAPEPFFPSEDLTAWSFSSTTPLIAFGEGVQDAEKNIQLYPFVSPPMVAAPGEAQSKQRTEMRTTVRTVPMVRKKAKVDIDHPEDPTGAEYSETAARAAKVTSIYSSQNLASPPSRHFYKTPSVPDSVHSKVITYSIAETPTGRFSYNAKTATKIKATKKTTTKAKKDQQSIIIIIDTDTKSINIEIDADENK